MLANNPRMAAGALAVVVGLVLAGCSASDGSLDGTIAPSAEDQTSERTLRTRVANDLLNVDPAFTGVLADEIISASIFEGLVGFDPGTWDVVNVLAEEFEVSPDGLRYTFKLREGVQFHGGYGEVTAEDVKFSYERIAGLTTPEIESTYASDWEALEEVRVTGRYEGEIVLKYPFAPLMRTTLPTTRGAVIPKAAVEELGDEFATNPVGTGPYELTDWVPSQLITLSRFEDHWGAETSSGGGPDFDRVEMRPIEADSAAENAFDAGELDFTSIPYSSVARYENNDEVEVLASPTLDYKFLAMNVQDEFLSNIDLRRAIRAAVDVDGVIEAATDGVSTRANAIIPEAMGMGYWEDAPVRQPDPEQAREHLERSGLEDVTLTLHVINREQESTIAQIVQENLEEVGIGVELIVQEPATFFAEPPNRAGGPDRQLVVDSYITQPDPSWSIVWFTCPQVDAFNDQQWCDQRFQDLFDQAQRELDPEARHDLYVEMQELWDEEANTVWFYYPTKHFVVNDGDVTPVLRPDGRPDYPAFKTP